MKKDKKSRISYETYRKNKSLTEFQEEEDDDDKAVQ